MARSRKNRKKLAYGTLEQRRLLAGDSVFFLDTATSTLQIRAGDSNVVDAAYRNEMSFSADTDTNELVVTEANATEQRFDLSAVSRISYRGTFGDDLFTNNTDIPARVVGFAGDDMITSGGGDDVVIAANGDDVVFPGNGNDYVAGGQGDDQILEGDSTGNDRFFGGPGADLLESGTGADYVAGHEGDDIIRGGDHNDYIFGLDGADQLFGGSGRDFIYGGNDNDVIVGEFGNDRILGQDGNDEISGGEGDDVVLGGDGNDTINGNEGNDRLIGNYGNDVINGGIGADDIVSGTAASNGTNFGFDTVTTGNDTDVDRVLAHPTDTLTLGAEDNYVDTEIIRRNLQTRFLTQNLSNPGWQQTDSGLQYRTVVVGTGETPVPTDIVRTGYVGTFIDGTQFDANAGYELRLNRFIAGWIEGLQLMNVGGTIELAIPSSLAYGPNGQSSIPGGSTLLFEVDLLGIIIEA